MFTVDGTGGTWKRRRTVTVTAAEDDDAVKRIVVLTHTDGKPTRPIVSAKVTVTVNGQRHTRGVTVISAKELEVPGGGLQYVYRRSGYLSRLAATVTVTVTGASGDVTVIPSQLTFTSQGVLEPDR